MIFFLIVSQNHLEMDFFFFFLIVSQNHLEMILDKRLKNGHNTLLIFAILCLNPNRLTDLSTYQYHFCMFNFFLVSLFVRLCL